MNRLDYLKRAIDSVLEQKEIDLELVIVDNGSSDGTRAHLEKLSRKDCRVNYIRLTQNRGACYARNLAIENASGKYLTGLDDDDYFSPGRLRLLLNTYLKKKGCAYTYADDGFVINNIETGNSNNKPRTIDINKLRYRNFVGNQVFSETSKFLGVGGFDESLHALQDYDLWLRMTEKYGSGKKTPGILQYIDIGNHQRISSSTHKFSGYMQLYRKHKHAMTPAQRRQQLLTAKHDCRDSISLRNFIRLFDMHLVSGKIRILFSRVLRGAD